MRNSLFSNIDASVYHVIGACLFGCTSRPEIKMSNQFMFFFWLSPLKRKVSCKRRFVVARQVCSFARVSTAQQVRLIEWTGQKYTRADEYGENVPRPIHTRLEWWCLTVEARDHCYADVPPLVFDRCCPLESRNNARPTTPDVLPKL